MSVTYSKMFHPYKGIYTLIQGFSVLSHRNGLKYMMAVTYIDLCILIAVRL